MVSKLIEKIQKTKAPICVGLDPMLGYIPEHVKEKADGMRQYRNDRSIGRDICGR